MRHPDRFKLWFTLDRAPEGKMAHFSNELEHKFLNYRNLVKQKNPSVDVNCWMEKPANQCFI